MESTIERGFEHRQDAVGSRLAGAASILVVRGFAGGRLDRHTLLADALGLGGKLVASPVDAIGGSTWMAPRSGRIQASNTYLAPCTAAGLFSAWISAR